MELQQQELFYYHVAIVSPRDDIKDVAKSGRKS